MYHKQMTMSIEFVITKGLNLQSNYLHSTLIPRPTSLSFASLAVTIEAGKSRSWINKLLLIIQTQLSLKYSWSHYKASSCFLTPYIRVIVMSMFIMLFIYDLLFTTAWTILKKYFFGTTYIVIYIINDWIFTI